MQPALKSPSLVAPIILLEIFWGFGWIKTRVGWVTKIRGFSSLHRDKGLRIPKNQPGFPGNVLPGVLIAAQL